MDDQARYDAILLHNLKDLELVRGVDRLLQPHGLSIWFSDRDLRFGDRLTASIGRAMHRSRFVLLCLGPHDLGNYQDWETSAAITDAVALGRPVIPVLMPGAAPERIELPFVRDLVSVDLRAGLDVSPQEVARLVVRLREGRPAPPDQPEPLQRDGKVPRDEVDSVDQVTANAIANGLTVYVGDTLPDRHEICVQNSAKLAAALVGELGLAEAPAANAFMSVPQAGFLYSIKQGADRAGRTLKERVAFSSLEEPEAYREVAGLLVATRRLGCFAPTSSGELRLLVVTTNVDLALERAFLRAGLPFTRLLFHSNPAAGGRERERGALHATEFPDPRPRADGAVELGHGHDALRERRANELSADELARRRASYDRLAGTRPSFETYLSAVELNALIRERTRLAGGMVPDEPDRQVSALAGTAQPLLLKLFGSYERDEPWTLCLDHYYRLGRLAENLASPLQAAFARNAGLLVGFHLTEPPFLHLFETWLRRAFESENRERVAIIQPPIEAKDGQDRIDHALAHELRRDAQRRFRIQPAYVPIAEALGRLREKLKSEGNTSWDLI